MKELLHSWDRAHPTRLKSMFTAISNVVPSHMMDRSLFDFENFTTNVTGKKSEGDILFDRDEAVSNFEQTLSLD
jgi:tRNA 2-thiocytidine biosynthesis protein TtcA